MIDVLKNGGIGKRNCLASLESVSLSLGSALNRAVNHARWVLFSPGSYSSLAGPTCRQLVV
jgi:hypothetical protein